MAKKRTGHPAPTPCLQRTVTVAEGMPGEGEEVFRKEGGGGAAPPPSIESSPSPQLRYDSRTGAGWRGGAAVPTLLSGVAPDDLTGVRAEPRSVRGRIDPRGAA